jgi:DnaJ family protein C protein 28
MSLEKLIESRIQDAVAAGAFEHLPGAGKPFRFDTAEALAGNNWMGFKVLSNGGMLPPWLLLAREIEDDWKRLERITERYDEWLALAAESGNWRANAGAIARLRGRFIEAARELRKKQDRFNLDAPAISLERPAIWIEYHLGRLDDRLRASGAPPALFDWLRGDADDSG